MGNIVVFDGLRGVLAIWVVIFHIFSISGYKVPSTLDGQHAVTVFFILSGFVIAKLITDRREGYLVFITRRFFRLFPVYAVCLLIAVCLFYFGIMPRTFNVDQTFNHVISHISMLHGLVPSEILPNAEKTLLNPAWSISVEWQFYIVAPFLFFLLMTWPVAGLVVLLLAAGFSRRLIISNFSVGGASLFAYIQFFSLGIVSLYVWNWMEKYHALFKGNLSLVVIVVPLLLIPFLGISNNMGVFVWLLAYSVAVYDYFGEKASILFSGIAGFLRSRSIVWLGVISYPLYLIHEPVVWFFVRFQKNYLSGLRNFESIVAVGVAALVASLFFAQILGVLVERPGIAFGKRIAGRKKVSD